MAPTKTSKKRKLPKSFLDCPSLAQVVDFKRKGRPQEIISTPVASDLVKELFLDRLKKEIAVLRPKKNNNNEDSFVMIDGKLQKKRVERTAHGTTPSEPSPEQKLWTDRVIVGTNQSLRMLEKLSDKESSKVLLIVLARDVYPPTMLAHVPALAKQHRIPILLLPGKSSNEMGRVLGIRKTSILVFRQATMQDPQNEKINSFVQYVKTQITNDP